MSPGLSRRPSALSDLSAGGGVPPGVHAGPVGAGEAAGAAHPAGGRRGRPGLQSGCGGTACQTHPPIHIGSQFTLTTLY